MGKRADFQNIPVSVFDAMGDIVVDGSLRHYTTNYSAGGVVTETHVDHPVRVIENTVEDSALAGGIAKTGDRKFLTPAIELSIRPEEKDSVILGSEWNIYLVTTDPAEALWILYARQ